MSFLREIFSDNGKASASRMCSAITLFSSVVWVSYLVFRNHQMPDLAGVSLFLSVGIGSSYGVNKLADVLSPKTTEKSS